MDNDQHGLVRRMELPQSDPAIIEDHVWIGSVILPGVRIGSRAVIGAGSIVTKDIPPRCVAAGILRVCFVTPLSLTKSCPGSSAALLADGGWSGVVNIGAESGARCSECECGMNNAATKSVLVTGGAGYIGPHTCKIGAQEGYQPIAFDNLSSGHIVGCQIGASRKGDTLDRSALDRVIEEYVRAAVCTLRRSPMLESRFQIPESIATMSPAR